MKDAPPISCPIHWEESFVQAGNSHAICRKCGTRFKVDRGEGWSNYRDEPVEHRPVDRKKKEAT